MSHGDPAAMAEAIALSRRGFPAPNPRVGCVIVKDGKIVGRGFHESSGQDHAEVMALKEAGSSAKGADVYVTLEPCRHHGRTPPCTEAVIAAGVAKVYVAVLDPNVEAAGGADQLRGEKIPVEVGMLSAEASLTNAPWLIAMRRQSPFVHVKAAITLDGMIARTNGESKWITSEQARQAGHVIRAEMGAVLVGVNTVLADNPRLTARIPGVSNAPLRVVLDPNHRLSGKEHIFREEGPCIWFVNPGQGNQSGETPLGSFEVTAILAALWQMGVRSLLVEGGGKTIRSFFEARVVDQLTLFVAPKIFGAGIPWLGTQPTEFDKLEQAVLISQRQIANDVELSYAISADLRNICGSASVE